MTTATMTRNELTENELNLVNGGEDGENISIADILEKYKINEPDPYSLPAPEFPWLREPTDPFDPFQLIG